jgi:hypothetical protein
MYINDPINCLYMVGSTKSEPVSESCNFLRLVTIVVEMDLQSIIPKFMCLVRENGWISDEFGIQKSAADPNLYYHIDGNECLILVLYVEFS